MRRLLLFVAGDALAYAQSPNWSQLILQTMVPPLTEPMVYDSARGELVMFSNVAQGMKRVIVSALQQFRSAP